MQTKKGRVVGCINSFDKTPEGKPQKLRIKTDWTNGDGRVGGNTTQLQKIQKRDGYAYQIVPCELLNPIETIKFVQMSLAM